MPSGWPLSAGAVGWGFPALSEGEVDDCAVECWMHGSRFDLRTGAVLNPPATRAVAAFPVRVDGEWVLVAVP